MSKYSDDPTVSKPIIEMLTIANEFCFFLEQIEKKEANEILNFFYRIGPLMYLKGSLLPDIEVENPEANERFVTSEQWENLFNALREKLGKKDEYWIIDPQYINENEPLKASLSENITDIYQDMKDFLMLYQKNTFAARQNAVKECTNLFSNHWGYRIVNSMSKIHYLIHDKEEENLIF
ncbi:MAG: DUF5063 domain-containing protein [Bacteroidales bacterium]|nr:DUF5063 domain-containing protein [Bacteroidales bacterium]